MASPFGGQFVFSQAGSTVTLGINNGTAISPAAVTGNFNIEVFTNPSLTSVPTTLDAGFNAGALDPNGGLQSGTNFLIGSSLTLGTGAYLVTDQKGGASITLGSGNQTVTGATGDTLTGGSGTAQVINAAANSSVVGGTGTYNIVAGSGDTISGPSSGATGTTSGQLVLGTNDKVTLPGAGSYTVTGAAGDTITAAAGAANVTFAGSGFSINLTGNTGTELFSGNANAAAGNNDTITAGAGNATLYGGSGDLITMGTGNQYVNGQTGGEKITVGSAGADSITALAGDTVVGGAASLQIINTTTLLASNVLLNMATQTGSVVGGQAFYLGSGDTITAGAGNTTITGALGKDLITDGSSGLDNITGSTVAGSPDTVLGGGANLTFYGLGANNELINLAGSAGNATVNTFSSGETGDTVIASNGADSVWGGAGARIGVGATTPSGTATFDHSTGVAGASVAFGTNDAVAGSSTAKVSVTNFNTTTDTVFYAGHTGTGNNAQDAAIIAAATTTSGNTTIVLPDGTSMTFVGLASAAALKFTS